jgi:hypothetical protein
MAGAGAKLFTSGSVLTADQVNTYLMDQAIMKFASTSARDAAFGGAGEPVLAEGMFAYTTDTNTLWLYNGSSWVNLLGSDIGEQALSNRNVIINGAMQVAQRGTSTASITTEGYYTADRFYVFLSSLGTWTQSLEADAPTGSGFRNSVKMLCTTADASPAAGDLCTIRQAIEGQNVQQFLKGTASAKQFSVSFWVKSNVTGTYIAELRDADNTRTVSASYTVSVSGTWEKKTITFPADTTGAFDNNNDASLFVNFPLGAGSTYTSGTLATTWVSTNNANRYVGQTNLAAATSNYWQVTGVQLEASSVSTPFEFEDFGVTLAKCQRYYTRFGFPFVNTVENFGSGINFNTTDALIQLRTPVTMRASASGVESFSLVLDGSGANPAVTTITVNQGGTNVVLLYAQTTAGGLTQFRPVFLRGSGSGSHVSLSAEL